MRYALVFFDEEGNKYEIKGYILDSKVLNSLDMILNFTTLFNNEKELLKYLQEIDCLPQNLSKGTFQIEFYRGRNSEPKILEYGVTYANDKKFLDINVLIKYINAYITTPEFIEAFLEKYYDYLKDVKVFSEELNFIRNSYKYFIETGFLSEHTTNAMNKFIDYYCFKRDGKGRKYFSLTQTRELGMFVADFDKKYNSNIKPKYYYNIEELECLINHYTTLLLENNLTDEQREIYEKEISKLNRILDLHLTDTIENTVNEEENELRVLLDHYYDILKEGNITDEDRAIYEAEITKIEKRLNDIDFARYNNLNLSRRKDDEVTED